MGTDMDEAIQNEKKYTIADARHVHSFTIETQPRDFKESLAHPFALIAIYLGKGVLREAFILFSLCVG